MEKKYFLIIPVFFILFSFLFPFHGGVDRFFIRNEAPVPQRASDSIPAVIPPFPGRECTCYLTEEGFSIAGFLDGSILINEKNSGFKPFDHRTSGKFQTVYSVAVSEDKRYLAVISGVYPKVLSVYHRKQDVFSLIYRVDLQKDVRSATYLSFSGDMLFYEDISGISALSLTTLSRFTLAFPGALRKVAFDPGDEYVYVYSGDDNGDSFIHIFLFDGRLIASAPYAGDRLSAFRLVEQ